MPREKTVRNLAIKRAFVIFLPYLLSSRQLHRDPIVILRATRLTQFFTNRAHPNKMGGVSTTSTPSGQKLMGQQLMGATSTPSGPRVLKMVQQTNK